MADEYVAQIVRRASRRQITREALLNNKEIRENRIKAGMTQSVYASYMGVSNKTVEAWEGGRTHPTGPVFILLDILAAGEELEYIVVE